MPFRPIKCLKADLLWQLKTHIPHCEVNVVYHRQSILLQMLVNDGQSMLENIVCLSMFLLQVPLNVVDHRAFWSWVEGFRIGWPKVIKFIKVGCCIHESCLSKMLANQPFCFDCIVFYVGYQHCHTLLKYGVLRVYRYTMQGGFIKMVCHTYIIS